jgi:hypothetical protein
MEINLELVISIMILLATGLGLTFALKFLKWLTGLTLMKNMKWVLDKPFVRLALWLILGSLFVRPFMDCASLLIESARIPYWLMQPVSERSLPYGWEISHYACYVGIRMLLFGMVYGYAIRVVPKIISMLALEKGIPMSPRGIEGIYIALICGSLLHSMVTSIAFSIQQLPIPALLGNEDNIVGYFMGWLIVFFVLPLIMYVLNKIINKKIKSAKVLGAGLP